MAESITNEQKRAEKFGKEYKREKYMERKERLIKIQDLSKKLCDDFISEYEKKKPTNTLQDLILKEYYVMSKEFKEAFTTLKFCDEMNGDELTRLPLKLLRQKIHDSRMEKQEFIKNVCNELSNKVAPEITTSVFVMLCVGGVLYIDITSDPIDQTFQNYCEETKTSICTSIKYPERILGHFRGSKKDGENLTKYIQKKYPDACVMFGANGRVNDYYKIDETFEELEDKLGLAKHQDPIDNVQLSEPVQKTSVFNDSEISQIFDTEISVNKDNDVPISQPTSVGKKGQPITRKRTRITKSLEIEQNA